MRFHPLTGEVLKEMDSIVINPPAKGAFKQVNEIIKSSVKIVVYVSCNINSFNSGLAGKIGLVSAQ